MQFKPLTVTFQDIQYFIDTPQVVFPRSHFTNLLGLQLTR